MQLPQQSDVRELLDIGSLCFHGMSGVGDRVWKGAGKVRARYHGGGGGKKSRRGCLAQGTAS